MGERLRYAIERRKEFLLQELSKYNKHVKYKKPLCEICLSDLEREYRHALGEKVDCEEENHEKSTLFK